MTEGKKQKVTGKQGAWKIGLGVLALVVVVGFMALLYAKFSAKPVEGSKEITIEVVDNEKKSTVYELKTDAEYLRQAMEEAEGLTFEGEEGQYGLSISIVNGLRADYTLDGAYWSFYVNDEYCNYGVDTQPVTDGDAFKIEYTAAQ
ncbi:MAG: DUF4430 domain-containing protein [Lachnospiraceae bacterium]|nr:DUF4430 domain-containing protein [Lachnospiraceae bacterium]